MRILTLTSNDARNGGAIAIHRLHTALLKSGHESQVLVGSEKSFSEGEESLPRNVFWKALDYFSRKMSERLSYPDMVRPSFRNWKNRIAEYHPDLIHLHWTYGAAGSLPIPLNSIPSLSARYPLVWTFHDMWGMTGGCTNSFGCDRWKTGCGKCPLMKPDAPVSTISLKRDTTDRMWKSKKRIFDRSDVSVICPSGWMSEMALQSPFFKRKTVRQVYNILDTAVFRASEKKERRLESGIPPDAFVLLFIGKSNSVYAYVERARVLLRTLDILRERMPDIKEKVIVLIVGERGEELAARSGFRCIALGGIHNQKNMVKVYSAADIFLHLSFYDNLPGVVQESLACGTPVVASNVGGIPEMVKHLETGYLAEAGNPASFADGISLLMENEPLRQKISKQAREFAVRNFSEEVIMPKILDVYQNAISRNSGQ